jgi:hypothetical protein
MSAKPDRVPDWLLERLAAGELPDAQARELRERLSAQGEGHRLTDLAASNSEILAALPPKHVVVEIERRSALAKQPARKQAPFLLRQRWTLSMATACAAGLLMFFALREPTNSPGDTADDDGVKVKGPERMPELRIYRKGQAGPEVLRSNAQVHKGDTLQIRYVAAGKHYGAVASIDGRGVITFHLPEAPGAAAALERDGERALVHAYELDDSPGFERFVFVTSDAPFGTDAILPALKNGGALPSSFSTFELTLKKEAP